MTIHDAAPWLFPVAKDAHQEWVRRMAARARKHADAVVVPTHAVADGLSRFVDFGSRVRVIGGAVSSVLHLPDDETTEVISKRLNLSDEYALVVGTLEPRRGIEQLMRAASLPEFPDLPVLHVGPPSWNERTFEQLAFSSGAPEGRLRHLDPVGPDELAVLIDRATVMVVPGLHEGFGQTALEALHFGTPLIHSTAPSLLEVVADAGVAVESSDQRLYPRLLAEAIADTVSDSAARARLSIVGRDRSRAFSWRDTAEKVWQLHADL